jgi:hypothetical protein
VLRRCLELVPDDGPAVVLLRYMDRAQGKAPPGWAGFRALDEK